MDPLKFTKMLVKGRIAETVFSQMLRDTGNFTVLEFGYEKIIPELVQRTYNHQDPIIETLRVAPDFAVIDQSTGKVQLIEVKFRWTLEATEILKNANKMHNSWNPSYLFIATLDGFYFDEINNIIANNGNIPLFTHPKISEEVQTGYLQILKDFESNRHD